MTLTVTGHGTKVTDSVQEFTEKKVDKLYRYLPNIQEMHVEYTHRPSRKGPDRIVAQVTVRHQRGAILRAVEEADAKDHRAPQVALTGAVEKMYRQIRRFKNKRRDKRQRESSKYEMTQEELLIAETIPEEELPAEPAAEPQAEEQIIRRKNILITAMTAEEAIDQMELLAHDFFMFFNLETNSINVLYRRKSEGYGVLVPEIDF